MVVSYYGRMGNGDVIFYDHDPLPWEPVTPGTIIAALWKIACGKR